MSGVAAARALTDDRGLVPAFVAGLSIGAFAAAVTAGVLTLADAMSAVRLRGDRRPRPVPASRRQAFDRR
jgi:malonate decarboxylase epsilon subunit